MGILNTKVIKNLPASIINGLENNTIPFANYFFSFIFIIFLRDFIEAYSQKTNHLNLPVSLIGLELIHFILFYIMIAMLLTVLFYFATRTPIIKIIRVILPGFILLLFPPIFDLIITFGHGINLRYIQPDYDIDLLHSFGTYAGGFAGISLGIKIEVLFLLIASYIYFRLKNTNILRSIIFVFLIYTVLFLASALPFFIKWIQECFGYPYQFSNEMMIHFYLLANFILLLCIGFLTNKKIAITLLQDIRLPRLIFYELMLILGVALALSNNLTDIITELRFNNDSIINIMLAMISIFFASFFSIVFNNLSDIDIDKISNKNRPLIKSSINPAIYANLGYVALVLAFFYAFMISPRASLLIGVPIASYYLYSMPPLRIKRVFLISKLAISLSALVLIILGYTLIAENVVGFPNGLFLIFLVFFSIAANVIDLKDIKGDRAANIPTLPIVIGEEKAKRVIGIAFWITSLLFIYLFNSFYWLPLLFAIGGLQFYLINRKNYKEAQVLWLTNLSFLFLICYLLLSP